MYNKLWKEGKLPKTWKHSIIVPIVKPGKDRSEATSYRPIASSLLTSNKMERLIVNRLAYEIESKELFTQYQSGFRKGRTTMDSILFLESEIRKAQINKEVVIGEFVDVGKAYDMIWKEGLLIKMENMGILGRMLLRPLGINRSRKGKERLDTRNNYD